MKKTITSFAVVSLLSMAVSAAAFASPGTVDGYVNFRSAPSTSSTVYQSLRPGTNIEILDQVNKYWLKISVNGKVGYVSPSYINYSSAPTPTPAPTPAPSTSANASQVIAQAKALIGITSYQYGVNKAPSVMDCSAFTKYVFGKVGISLKWGTRYQKDAGSYVSKSNLKPGDLVFFSVGSSSSIGHVGIYIGNGQFIHNSPSFDGVGISSLTSGYWDNHYITARRVL